MSAVSWSGPERGVLFVVVDNPPVNALGQAVRQGLMDAVATAEADDDVHAVCLSCVGPQHHHRFCHSKSLSHRSRPLAATPSARKAGSMPLVPLPSGHRGTGLTQR